MSDKTVDNEPKITAETVDKATQSILEKTLALIQCYPQGWEERTPNLRQQIAQESGIPIEILTGRLTQIEDATTELLDASAKAGEDPIKLAALGKLKEKKVQQYGLTDKLFLSQANVFLALAEPEPNQ